MSEPSRSRKTPRVLSLNLVSVTEMNEEGVPTLDTMGRTLDISDGGIKLETTAPISISSEVELSIAFGEEIIRPRGRVVHLEEAEEGWYTIGLVFLDLSPEELQVIQTYLAQKSELE